jgi:Ran GTPase-activating protein (RanGAP) involved in mRNA processing and transport
VVLTSIDLSWNNLGPEGGKAIAAALQVNAVLTYLGLRKNNLDAEGVKALAKALRINAVLKQINLQDNGFGNSEQLLRDAVNGRNEIYCLCESAACRRLAWTRLGKQVELLCQIDRARKPSCTRPSDSQSRERDTNLSLLLCRPPAAVFLRLAGLVPGFILLWRLDSGRGAARCCCV